MSIYSVGRICVKLAGRDAGQKCVVLSEAKDGRVLIDGATRRREVSINHLEPLADVVAVKAGASTAEVSKVLEPLGVVVRETKAKKATVRPVQVRLTKKSAKKPAVKTAKPAKKAKVAPKKAKAPLEDKVEAEAKVAEKPVAEVKADPVEAKAE